jgi:hypothetical protein
LVCRQVIRGRQAVLLVDAGEDGFLEDAEHAESGVPDRIPVELEGRTGTNAFSPSFACLAIRAASTSVWRYSANAGVIVVEAELVDGAGVSILHPNPDEISRPGQCVKRCAGGGKR